MYSFLDPVPKKVICRYLEIAFPNLACEDLIHLDRYSIYGILYTLYGYDLLYEKKIRRFLAESLDELEIRKFAKDLGLKTEGKPFDLAISISKLTWRIGSKCVWTYANYFSIPHEYLPARQKSLAPIEIIEPFSPPPNLFDYQKDLSKALVNFLTDPEKITESCLLQLPTGSGKTRTVIEALTVYCNEQYQRDKRVSILWLAHTEELCEQAIESFRRTWQAKGDYDNRAIRFWGDFKCPLEEMFDCFIVAGFKKITQLAASSPDKYEKLLSKIDITIIDEAHKALAPSIKSIIENLKKKELSYIIGLTATPGRSAIDQKENEKLANLFNRNLLVSTELGDDPISTLQERGILARIDLKSLYTKISCDLSSDEKRKIIGIGDFSSTILRRLAKNRKRNELIIAQVVEQIKLSNPTLVFACTVDHAKELAVNIATRGFRASVIDCRMRRNLRRHIVNDFKLGVIDVLFNFGVLSTGFDAPNIRTVLIARPTTSIVLYSQMIGRGLRGSLVGGSEKCILIDIKDNFENFGQVDKVYSFFEEYWER
jgi:DNA repair protein RadD